MAAKRCFCFLACVLGIVGVTGSMSPILALAQTAAKPHVLMISIDGMRPDYVTRADQHQLQVPNLHKFVVNGTYATGVVGVVPTITFPSHTTLVTGVWPKKHGILNNAPFDPLFRHPGEWYWYFGELKAETLYQAAEKADLTTASVGWPVTVGAPIDYLIVSVGSRDKEVPKTELLHPVDIKQEIGVKLPEGSSIDQKRAAWAIGIINKYKPNLMLLHLILLDHVEHEHGPFSPQADAMLEKIDKLVGDVVSAERATETNSKIIIVSDHGFATVNHLVRINELLAKAGLIRLSTEKSESGRPQIASWEAEAWNAGGSAAIMLREPRNKQVLAKVRSILNEMAADPKFGVNRIIVGEEIRDRGGFPAASFLVDFKPGWSAAGGMERAAVEDLPHAVGTHGYWPAHPQMYSTFMCDGPGIARHRDLGVVDMRQIAPSVAEMLGVKLPGAKLKAVDYKLKSRSHDSAATLQARSAR